MHQPSGQWGVENDKHKEASSDNSSMKCFFCKEKGQEKVLSMADGAETSGS